MSEEVEAHIYKKFEILQKLGKGAYGIVWKAIEKKTKKIVALKKVFEAFHNETDAQRTFREVMILQELNGHENIVKLLNVIKAENNKDLYLVFEFMETDLHAVIKAGILKKVHKQFIIYQLLKGLKYMHSGDIIHRDLKPSNLLINSECHVKIADFGLARSIALFEDDYDPIMTEYVATRWYRAPEIVLGSNRYSKNVDVWSVGCILAELINDKALFPGKSTLNQIELILEVIGKPSPEDIKAIHSQNAASIISSISIKNRRQFAAFFKDASGSTLDFLHRCLEFNPDKRMTIDEALAHPFVAQFRDEKDEPILDHAIKIPISDNTKLSIKEYREALYNDIIKKKKEQRKVWRQKYLQQLGIDVKNDAAKKDLFKNLMTKTKEPFRSEALVNAKSRSPIPNAHSHAHPVPSRAVDKPTVLAKSSSISNKPVGMPAESREQQAGLLQPRVDNHTNENLPRAVAANPPEYKSHVLNRSEQASAPKKESNYSSQKNFPGSTKELTSHSVSTQKLQAKNKFTSKERRTTNGVLNGSTSYSSNLFSQLNYKPANYQKASNYYRDVLSYPLKK